MSLGPNDHVLKKVEDKLGYSFKDKLLLRQAFVHPSAGRFNNMRLAWIGDAALQLVVSDLVFEALPDSATTHILHDRRTTKVRRVFCAAGAIKLGWDKVAITGKCYPKEKALTTNMLAEIFEAVWGALYKDSGKNQQVLRKVYTRHFPLRIVSSKASAKKASAAIGKGLQFVSSKAATKKASAATAEKSAMALKSWWNKF